MRYSHLLAIFLTGCAANPLAPQALVRTPIRTDKEHPWKIDERYYPAESLRLHEEGNCTVHMYVEADGSVSGAHIIQSSGSTRLDAACLASIDSARFLPATINGKPIAEWGVQSIHWNMSNYKAYVKADRPLHVGPAYYPKEARERRQEGQCVVHVYIEANGQPKDAQVLMSSGSPFLDQACLKAAREGEYWPGMSNDIPYGSWLDIPMTWRLTSK
jgi:TonB family protein